MIPSKCTCGARPHVLHTRYFRNWAVICKCGGFGVGTNVFSAIGNWNKLMEHKRKMKELDNE